MYTLSGLWAPVIALIATIIAVPARWDAERKRPTIWGVAAIVLALASFIWTWKELDHQSSDRIRRQGATLPDLMNSLCYIFVPVNDKSDLGPLKDHPEKNGITREALLMHGVAVDLGWQFFVTTEMQTSTDFPPDLQMKLKNFAFNEELRAVLTNIDHARKADHEPFDIRESAAMVNESASALYDSLYFEYSKLRCQYPELVPEFRLRNRPSWTENVKLTTD